ncbi:MAG: hypothetical protein V4491_01260, partial [Pseudomonadota bacterium]
SSGETSAEPEDEEGNGHEHHQHRPHADLFHRANVTPALSRGLPAFGPPEEQADPGSRPG